MADFLIFRFSGDETKGSVLGSISVFLFLSQQEVRSHAWRNLSTGFVPAKQNPSGLLALSLVYCSRQSSLLAFYNRLLKVHIYI